MLIRTLRPCVVRGVTAPAGLPFDVPEAEGQALRDVGDAELWVPPARGPLPFSLGGVPEAAAPDDDGEE